jgi:hypothetical protein
MPLQTILPRVVTLASAASLTASDLDSAAATSQEMDVFRSMKVGNDSKTPYSDATQVSFLKNATSWFSAKREHSLRNILRHCRTVRYFYSLALPF